MLRGSANCRKAVFIGGGVGTLGPNWSYADSFHPPIWSTLMRCQWSLSFCPFASLLVVSVFISKHLSLRIYFLNSALLLLIALSGLCLLGNLYFRMSKKMKANTRVQSGMFDQKFLLCLKVSFYGSCNSKNKKNLPLGLWCRSRWKRYIFYMQTYTQEGE